MCVKNKYNNTISRLFLSFTYYHHSHVDDVIALSVSISTNAPRKSQYNNSSDTAKR